MTESCHRVLQDKRGLGTALEGDFVEFSVLLCSIQVPDSGLEPLFQTVHLLLQNFLIWSGRERRSRTTSLSLSTSSFLEGMMDSTIVRTHPGC